MQMRQYKCLNKFEWSNGDYKITSLREEDKYLIMKWRNEQIYHLRQASPLIKQDQENYFNTVVSKLFEQSAPNQLLFSYLENETCIGYGGLVHINWTDKNAEISFIMNTDLEKEYFQKHWSIYLDLIEQVAFKDLNLHKLFTYAFDVRPHLYPTIEAKGYAKEATLKEHCLFNGVYEDVVFHAKFNSNNN